MLITDANVGAAHGTRFEHLRRLTMQPGEAHKTLATPEQLWTDLAAMGATRASRIIALGGGWSATSPGSSPPPTSAHPGRAGADHARRPDRLAIGGKTGVDLPSAKNYVGAYHQPEAVHVIPKVLDTLPPAERAAGYAEVVKTASSPEARSGSGSAAARSTTPTPCSAAPG